MLFWRNSLLIQRAKFHIPKKFYIILKVVSNSIWKTNRLFPVLISSLPSLKLHLTMRVSSLPRVQLPSLREDQWQLCEVLVDFARKLFPSFSRGLLVSSQLYRWCYRSFVGYLPTAVGSSKMKQYGCFTKGFIRVILHSTFPKLYNLDYDYGSGWD